MSEPAIVPASYVKLSTLVDGTLRVVLDIEPKHRKLAHDLFDEPGVAVAVARLTNDAAVRVDHETVGGGIAASASAQGEGVEPSGSCPSREASLSPASDKPRRERTLAESCALRCGQSDFQRFLAQRHTDRWARMMSDDGDTDDAEHAARVVRSICRIDSRREFATNHWAAEKWLTLEADYLAHARGVAA